MEALTYYTKNYAWDSSDIRKTTYVYLPYEMLGRDIFTPDHYVFYQKDGGYHDFNAVTEYLYNALPLFVTE